MHDGGTERVLVLATANAHKVRELSAIAKDLPVDIRCLADYPGFPEVIEDGGTLEANAIKKAQAAAMLLGEWAAADDTGLEVDALGGAPGVNSARYAGPDCEAEANSAKLLAELDGVADEDRAARFVTVAALAVPGAEPVIFKGVREGKIATAPEGKNGFGYDPLFIDGELGTTFALMEPSAKNAISHRAAAFGALFAHVRQQLGV